MWFPLSFGLPKNRVSTNYLLTKIAMNWPYSIFLETPNGHLERPHEASYQSPFPGLLQTELTYADSQIHRYTHIHIIHTHYTYIYLPTYIPTYLPTYIAT